MMVKVGYCRKKSKGLLAVEKPEATIDKAHIEDCSVIAADMSHKSGLWGVNKSTLYNDSRKCSYSVCWSSFFWFGFKWAPCSFLLKHETFLYMSFNRQAGFTFKTDWKNVLLKKYFSWHTFLYLSCVFLHQSPKQWMQQMPFISCVNTEYKQKMLPSE